MLKFELITRSILRSKSFSLIFIANFTLAIFSLTFLQFFKSSVENSLESKSKSLLGADIVVTSRFPISDDQEERIVKLLPNAKKHLRSLTTVSMIATEKRSRLMEIMELKEGFPFYGGLTFKDKTTYPQKIPLLKKDEIWIHDDAAKILGLKIGEILKVGDSKFHIKKIVLNDTQKATNFSGFIPRVYLSSEGLKLTKLIQFGSTARYRIHFQFGQDLSNEELEVIENKVEKEIDRNLRVLSPKDGRDRLIRVLTSMTSFLSLVSLVSFFLGLVGLIYLYSGFLNRHKNDLEILHDLGISKKDICITYLLHLMVLIVIASAFVFAAILLVGPLITPLIQQYIDFDFTFNFDYLFFLKAFLTLMALSLAIGLPLIIPILDFKTDKRNKRDILYFVPFMGFLVLLSHIVTPMKYVGAGFSLLIFVITAIIFLIGFIVLRTIDFSGHTKDISMSLSFKNIVRQKKTSLTLFTSILLSMALFSLIPQVGASLSKALRLGVKDKPRFFVIDAKEEQISNLSSVVKDLGGKLENISPMIRGRIVKVNDIEFREHRKKLQNVNDEEKDDLKNRAVNLSYRSGLKKSEKLIEGVDFSGLYKSEDFSKPVEVSVEMRYARRRGIALGDRLTFDVLGLEVPAKVVNIREVKWTDFVPNFFLILQDGAINDAPKTLLATISYNKDKAEEVLLKLADVFPALTVIDVKNLFEEFSKLVSAVTTITDRMSFLSIFIGLLMCFIIIQYQMNLQKNNILLLKMIGVKNNIIRRSLLLEYGIISVAASFVGILIGSAGSYFLSGFMFDSNWSLRPDLIITYFISIPLLTLLVVYVFAGKIIGKKENHLFSE